MSEPSFLTTKPIAGKVPAVVLVNPKYPHNVGAAIRASSCFGLKQVWFTGERLLRHLGNERRFPREERMKKYDEVEVIAYERPLDCFTDVVPVAVELVKDAVPLPYFEHPEKAVYFFGPEDGGLGTAIKTLCHHFVVIPSRHCTNLASAVYIVLYDRMVKSGNLLTLDEQRGFACDLEG